METGSLRFDDTRHTRIAHLQKTVLHRTQPAAVCIHIVVGAEPGETIPSAMGRLLFRGCQKSRVRKHATGKTKRSQGKTRIESN